MTDHVPADQFIRIWQAADSVAEVVEITGMSRSAVNSRAHYYRSRGIPVKMMRGPLDVAQLSKLCHKPKQPDRPTIIQDAVSLGVAIALTPDVEIRHMITKEDPNEPCRSY